MVYRAYRVPYEWVPQLEKTEEKEIIPLDIAAFRVPNAAETGTESVVTVEGHNHWHWRFLCSDIG